MCKPCSNYTHAALHRSTLRSLRSHRSSTRAGGRRGHLFSRRGLADWQPNACKPSGPVRSEAVCVSSSSSSLGSANHVRASVSRWDDHQANRGKKWPQQTQWCRGISDCDASSWRQHRTQVRRHADGSCWSEQQIARQLKRVKVDVDTLLIMKMQAMKAACV